MSVMSAAETGSSPDIPRRRLRVATPAAGRGDGGPAASPLGAGAAAESDPAAPGDGRLRLAGPGLRATELRVREVRVVREASVRTLRAGGSGSAAAQTRVVAHSRAAAQTRATRTRTVSQRPGAVRLTRRGRLVVAGFAMLVVIGAATLLWMSVAGSVQASSRGGPAPRSPYQGMTQVVVQPGQTLWSIAAAAEPSANIWAVVQQITEVNALTGPEVRAGELLWVPRG